MTVPAADAANAPPPPPPPSFSSPAPAFPDGLLAAAAAAAASAATAQATTTTSAAPSTASPVATPPRAPSSPPSPALLHSLHSLTRRIATLSGVPDSDADADAPSGISGRDVAAPSLAVESLPALHAQLQRLHDHLTIGQRKNNRNSNNGNNSTNSNSNSDNHCATNTAIPCIPGIPITNESANASANGNVHINMNAPVASIAAAARAARAARGAAARLSAGSLPWDDLDGVEDIRVDSEDETMPVAEPTVRRKSSARRPRPPLPPGQRSSASLSTAPPLRVPNNLSQYSISSASQAVVVPLLSPSANAGLPILPDLPLDDDHPFGSARSSQIGGMGGLARPPSKLPLGSAANSYLTHMGSWKSLGHGAADRLHADYSKIFHRSGTAESGSGGGGSDRAGGDGDSSDSTALGESSIKIAAGHLYVAAPLAERWTIEHKIGEGGYATVRLATRVMNSSDASHSASNNATDRCVAAVKIISKRNEDTYNERMVSREVFSFRLIDMAWGGHDNIVELYEVCEDDDNVYLVMELLEGGELFARIAERGLYTERDAAALVVSMLASLAFCHQLNLTHRDVKPENFVFRNPDSNGVDVKLTDFGIAYYSEDPSALCKTLCGTPLYVAPEVLLRQPYGPEADLWSLGVIVHIMLVGYPPFDDNDLVQLVKKIKYRPVKFEGPEWALISEEGKQFVLNLLDKDASNRMNAQQALEHDWLKDSCRAATENRLDNAQTNIRSFVSRKRWRAAIQGVKAMNRLHHMMKDGRDDNEAGDDLDEISAERVEVIVVRGGSADHQFIQRQLSNSSSSSDERTEIPVRKILSNDDATENQGPLPFPNSFRTRVSSLSSGANKFRRSNSYANSEEHINPPRDDENTDLIDSNEVGNTWSNINDNFAEPTISVLRPDEARPELRSNEDDKNIWEGMRTSENNEGNGAGDDIATKTYPDNENLEVDSSFNVDDNNTMTNNDTDSITSKIYKDINHSQINSPGIETNTNNNPSITTMSMTSATKMQDIDGSENNDPIIAKPLDQRRIPSAVTSRTRTRSGSLKLAMDPAFESSDDGRDDDIDIEDEDERKTAPKSATESARATSNVTAVGTGTILGDIITGSATGTGSDILESLPTSKQFPDASESNVGDDDVKRRRGLMPRSISVKKRQKGGAGGSGGATSSGTSGGIGSSSGASCGDSKPPVTGRASIGCPPSGRSSLGARPSAPTGRASIGGLPSSTFGRPPGGTMGPRATPGATGTLGRMGTSPHVGGGAISGAAIVTGADEDSGRVGRTASRFDGSVVRKMSSHARRLVGRGKRVFGGRGDASAADEQPPVMLQMGEHRKQKRGFAWFR